MTNSPPRSTPPLRSIRRREIIALGAGVLGVGLLGYAATGTIAVAAFALGMTGGVTFGVSWATRRARPPEGRAGEMSHLVASTTPLGGVLRHCENAIVLTDAALRIRYANEAFGEISGDTPPPVGLTIAEALAHRLADGDAFARAVHELHAHPGLDGGGEITSHGTPTHTFEWRSVPLQAADGTPAGRGFVFHDRSQARELAGLKSDFLSTVTHELRTPLTSVKGSLQLVLSKSTALSPIDCELLKISLKNADRLIRLINDLLDISRLELGKIELTFGRVPTVSLIEEAVAGLRSYAAAREITIGCEVDGEMPPLQGDRDRLIQVLTNLISNAVKFSPARGHVAVRAERLAGEVAIAVRDWGVGIPAADQGRLFQRFQRLNPGHSDEPGTGLGLAISKAIIDRHGGRITLTSRENAGSTFSVIVPVATEPAVATCRSRDATRTGGATPLVLLVDDDEELGHALEEAWSDRYRVLRIERGVDALDTARLARPDIVLLDVVLPDLSGYDVLRILRTTAATASIPVIMLTVQPERPLAMNLGAVDVVGKPVDLEHLGRAIEQALEDNRVEAGPRVAAGQ